MGLSDLKKRVMKKEKKNEESRIRKTSK